MIRKRHFFCLDNETSRVQSDRSDFFQITRLSSFLNMDGRKIKPGREFIPEVPSESWTVGITKWDLQSFVLFLMVALLRSGVLLLADATLA